KPGLRTSAPRGASAFSALYLYCITQPPTNKGTITVQAPGIDGDGRVESLLSGRFLCWVSQVSREEFATRLNDNMQNLDWLAAASVRHQQVVAEITKHADVLPARFATVFLSPASLQRDVKRRAAELQRNLRRVSGCDEWGVKIHALARTI